MNITTLPLSFRPNRPFRILFTPFVASCISKFCGFNQVFPVNTMGLRNVKKYCVLPEYKQELMAIGTNIENATFFSDFTEEFRIFVQDSVAKGIGSGICSKIKQSISFCPCGRVEIPTDLLGILNKGNLPKLLKKIASGWICELCGSELKASLERTLVHINPTAHEDLVVLPYKIKSKVNAGLGRVMGQSVLISRNHRIQHDPVVVEGHMIDPDYCWMHYLDFLYRQNGSGDFIIVVGVNQIAQACRLIAFNNVINRHIKISLIISPMIDLDDMSQLINNKTTVNQLLEILGSTECLRIFLSILAQWSREVYKINFDDIALIRESLRLKKLKSGTPSSLSPIGLTDVLGFFNREEVLKILKRFRQKLNLSEREYRVFSSIT